MFRKLYIILALCLLAIASIAQQLPEPMHPARLVNDFAGMFSLQEQTQLEGKLVDFDGSTSTQIAVVTVADLDGAAISDYAARLFDKWGIGGNSQNNNGILILVKPKTADSRGEVFISTGYGVEGAVPDALAGRIVDYDILPAFREGNYFQGVDRATTTLIELTRGEYTADEYLARKGRGDKIPSGVVALILIAVFLIIGSIGGSNRGKRQTITSGGDIASAVLLGSLLSGSRGGGGGFGGFSGGGGGFGGFGGGFTGGGGAGGSW